MRRLVIASALAALIVGTALTATATAATQPVGARRVSGPTPFAQCPATGGQYYPDAEAEPYITVDPRNSKHLIGIWQQDRYTDGGARGLVSATSWNRGRTWQAAAVPFSSCVPGGLNYERASDPWLSVGPDGAVYASGLSFDITSAPPVGGAPNAISAAVSRDGGRSWQDVRRVAIDSGHNGRSFTDKDSIVADPTTAGVAYLVWDLQFVNRADTSVRQPAFFSRTTDGGRTWSPAKIIAARGLNDVSFDNTILVDPLTDELYDIFTHGTSTGYSIDIVSSSDHGSSWTSPRHVVSSYDAVTVVDPNNQNTYVGGSPLVFSAALDPHSGRIYVAFDSGRFSAYDYDEIALTSSARGSATAGAHPSGRTHLPAGRRSFRPSRWDATACSPSATTTFAASSPPTPTRCPRTDGCEPLRTAGPHSARTSTLPVRSTTPPRRI